MVGLSLLNIWNLFFQDVRKLVMEHKGDCPEAAVTGKYILRWTENDDVDSGLKRARKQKEGLPAGSDEAATPPVKGKPGRKPKLVDGSTPAKVPKKPAAGITSFLQQCQ